MYYYRRWPSFYPVPFFLFLSVHFSFFLTLGPAFSFFFSFDVYYICWGFFRCAFVAAGLGARGELKWEWGLFFFFGLVGIVYLSASRGVKVRLVGWVAGAGPLEIHMMVP